MNTTFECEVKGEDYVTALLKWTGTVYWYCAMVEFIGIVALICTLGDGQA